MPSLRHRRAILALAIVASSSAVACAISVPRPEGTVVGRNGRGDVRSTLTDFRGGAVKKSAAAAKGDESESGKTGMSAATFNLIKACVGSGVLALPAGVAAIGDVSAALVPASIMVVGLGLLSAYSFFMLGRINDASEKKSSSMGDMWKNEVGEGSSWVVTLSCFLTPLGAALAYSIMLGDMLSSLAETAGLKGILATRHTAILAITSLVLYPLCGLKSLAALAPVSMVAIFGVAATCVFMYMRMASGAYAEGGAYFDTIASNLQPSFGNIGTSKVKSPSILVLGGMAATAYLVHFSALDFHNDLEDNTLKRFGSLVGMGFSATAVINILFMIFGFLTFGGNCAGLVLNNYSIKDIGATLVRLVTVISLVGSYPIFMRGIKSAWFELTAGGKDISEEQNKKTTTAFLAAITGLALVLENAGFMVGFTGATMGSAIIYIFPPILYLRSSARRIASGALEKTNKVKLERLFCQFLIALGAIVGVLGGIVAVLDSFFPGVL
uniref:Amino acid transporter transmembrane domain-containing protein n=1 Tax=Odontella aurita TaxID=265563 RepID=A0A7S4JZY9_9STRA|mmetsp:Transcript_58068/g.173307  ORF Transcript_58068/g.173307 Transcript_58068/m.173307 type:complete len:498 (+) Transcript_58068:112-1605(+)